MVVGVPQPHGVVLAPREHLFAVTREGTCANQVCVLGVSQHLLAARGIPEGGGFVTARGEQVFPS